MAKSMKFIVTLAGIASVFLAGCASKDFKEPGVVTQPSSSTTRSYSSNFQDTWNAVTQAISTYPLVTSTKDNGTIVTDWIKGKSDTRYSGYGETRIPYTIRYKFTIKVKPTNKGTSVNIASKEQYLTDSVTSGIDFSGSVYQWLDVESSTQKEGQFLAEIQKRLTSNK